MPAGQSAKNMRHTTIIAAFAPKLVVHARRNAVKWPPDQPEVTSARNEQVSSHHQQMSDNLA